jgi:hypothetical protein
MTLAELGALITLFLLLVTGLLALIVLCATLYPRLVARAQANVERMPLRCLLVGLVNFIFFGLLAAAFGSGGDLGGLLALLLLTTLFSFVALGITAVAAAIGDRLPLDGLGPLRRLSSGAGLLLAAALVPLVGWIGVVLGSSLIGLGGAIIALLRLRRE